MAIPSLLSSPRQRVKDTNSDSSSQDSGPLSARTPRSKKMFPDIGSRWMRTTSESKDVKSFGRIRSLFSTPSAHSNKSDEDSISSHTKDPLHQFGTSRAPMLGSLSNKLTSQHHLAIEQRPNDFTVHELVPGKLYFAVHDDRDHADMHKLCRPDLFFVTSEIHRRSYGTISRSRGPLDKGSIYRFWEFMTSMASYQISRGRKMLYYTTDHRSESCAAFLLASFLVLEHKVSAEHATKTLEHAVPGVHHLFPDTDLTLLDAMKALNKTAEKLWFNVDSFNVEEYEMLAEPMGGNMFCFGDRFVVFPPPTDVKNKSARRWAFSSIFYANMLQRLGATAVVRINDRSSYDKLPFVERRIKHHDLQFESTPSKTIVQKFLDMCDRQDGLVAVHGSEGSERSCTLICLWMMRHISFTAREAMAWVRLVRPGVSLRAQEQFLYDAEDGGWNGNWLKSEMIRSNDDEDETETIDGEEVVRWSRDPAKMKAVPE